MIKKYVSVAAFKYYEVTDFEVDEGTIPIFRDIVETYYESGGKVV